MISEENDSHFDVLRQSCHSARISKLVTGSGDLADYMVEEHDFFNGVEPQDPENPYRKERNSTAINE